MSNGSEEGSKVSQDCKLFIGGLNISTNTDTLKDYFGTWGTIVDAVVMKDPNTKRSRGFGFVTYDNASSVDDCLAARPHVIDGREVEAKRAVPREDNNPVAHSKTKKVFLGGLSMDTLEDDITEVLEQHGKVMEVTIMREKGTEKPRGFGFAIFEDTDVVDKLCIKRYVRIKDRDVEVKKAVSQEEMRKIEPPKRGGSSSSPYYGRDSGSVYSRGDPYASYPRGGMGYGAMSGYDYARYSQEYMRPDAYASYSPYSAYGDRSGAYAAYGGYGRGYDMQAAAYGSMYGAGSMSAAYGQSASNYGPSRTSYSGSGGEFSKERGTSRSYHPYRRV